MIFKSLKYGVTNLIKWFPIIWKDRSWDYEFILEILKFKLTNVENMFRYHGNHMNSERDADNVHRAILYLDRMINYDYHDDVFKHHDKKWGEIKMGFKDSGGGKSLLNITRPNIKTKEDEVTERKEYRRLLEDVEKHEKQDYEMFFGHLKKYIRSWWD